MSLENLRTESVQSAAVLAAMIEDFDGRSGATGGIYLDRALQDIVQERKRQNEKWGAQHHDPFTWLMILLEEVGELAREVEAPEGTVAKSYHKDAMRVARQMETLARSYLERGGLDEA